MKKFLLILVILLTLSGCMSVSKFNQRDIDVLLNKLLKTNTSLVNTSSSGYKYYLPIGVELLDSNNYNDKLYSNGDYYYLYVDLVSYYYEAIESFEENPFLYYSKAIDYNNKKGYLNITDTNDGLYKVEFVYNYSKIEAFIKQDNLKNAIINMSYILNSIKFNNSTSSVEVGDINEKFSEDSFDFLKPRKEGNFIDYKNQYGEYEEELTDSNIGNEESE